MIRTSLPFYDPQDIEDGFVTAQDLREYYEDHVRSFASFHISVWFRCFSVAEVTVLAEMAERMGAPCEPTLSAIADVRLENEVCGGFPMSQAGYAHCQQLHSLRERLSEYRPEPCFYCGGSVKRGAECTHC